MKKLQETRYKRLSDDFKSLKTSRLGEEVKATEFSKKARRLQETLSKIDDGVDKLVANLEGNEEEQKEVRQLREKIDMSQRLAIRTASNRHSIGDEDEDEEDDDNEW
jgi:hypothetical protein